MREWESRVLTDDGDGRLALDVSVLVDSPAGVLSGVGARHIRYDQLVTAAVSQGAKDADAVRLRAGHDLHTLTVADRATRDDNNWGLLCIKSVL